jgi:putative membrane protein
MLENTMISGYTDHAANERTFLAWIRTGIAVIALGFVIEKFNLFMLTLAGAALSGVHQAQGDVHQTQFARLASRMGRYDGLFFVLGGVGLVILALVRFVRTSRMIDDPQAYTARSIRTELILSAWLVLLVTIYSAYLAFS